MNANTIQIDGIKYEIVETVTREQCKEKHPNTYRNMVQTGQVAMHNVKRPNGRRFYVVLEYEQRNLSDRRFVLC